MMKSGYLETLEELELFIKNAIKVQPTRLDLNFGSQISIIPDSIGDISSLEHLAIYEYPKSIKEIPASIGKLSNLKILHISDCRILEYLPKSIGSLKN